MWNKIRIKFENSEKFYKGFPRKKKFPWEFSLNLIHIKYKGISFIKILQEVRSIYNKGIPY